MNDFYVYEWIRLDTNEPFYVGKGKGGRSSVSFRNPYFNNIVSKVGIENIAVSILQEGLSEKTSFEYEVYYISLYRDYFGFNLTNLTDGGEGVSGYKFTEEQCKNLSEALSGRVLSEEHKVKLRGKKASEETKRKIREALSGENNPMYGRTREKNHMWGKNRSEETKEKIRKGNKGKVLSEKTRRKISESRFKSIILILPDDQQKHFRSIKETSLWLGSVSENYSDINAVKKLLKGWTPKRGRWVGYSAMYLEDIEQETK